MCSCCDRGCWLCLCVCCTPSACVFSPVSFHLADRAERGEMPVSSEPSDSLWRHLLWSLQCVCVCLVCVFFYAHVLYVSLNLALPSLPLVTWDACLVCVCLWGGCHRLLLPSSPPPTPTEHLATVSLVLAGSLRHQSARWLEARGGLPLCHWLASTCRGGNSQSPAASCGVCMCVCFFFFLWNEGQQSHKQHCLQKKKPSLQKARSRSRVLKGGEGCVEWGVTWRESVPTWSESCWGWAGLNGWRTGGRLGDQGGEVMPQTRDDVIT